MSAHIPPGFAECSIPHLHLLNARPAVITFGIDITASPVADADLPNAVLEAYRNGFQTGIDNAVICGPAYVVVGQDGPADFPFTGTSTFAGTRAAESVNAAIALMYDKGTARPGRRGRGRMYVPWVLLDTEVDEMGRVTAGIIAGLNTRADTFRNNLAAAGLVAPMVLLHSPPIPAGLVPDPITGMTVDPIVGIQQRRLNR